MDEVNEIKLVAGDVPTEEALVIGAGADTGEDPGDVEGEGELEDESGVEGPGNK